MARIVSHSSLAHSLLENPANFSSAQLGSDALNQQFTQHVLDPINLLAMTAGGLSYKLARVASMSALSALPSLIRSPLISAFSLSVEVAAFRGVNHAWGPSSGERYLDASDFAREMLNFGSLKGVAFLMHGGNPLTMHVAQNLGMMLGEELGAAVHLTPESTGSFAQRFAHASAMNLALGIGTLLSAYATGHRVAALERNLLQASPRTHFLTHQVQNSLIPQMSRELTYAEYREILAAQNSHTRSAALPHGERSEGHQVREAFRRRRQALNPQSESFAAEFSEYVRLWEVTSRRWGADQFFAYVGREESKALRETLRTPEFDLEDGISPWVFRPEVARWFEVLPKGSGEAREWFRYLARAYEANSPLEPYIILAEKIDERGGVGDIERLAPQIRERMTTYPTTLASFKRLCRLYRALSDKLPHDHAENNEALTAFLRAVNLSTKMDDAFLPADKCDAVLPLINTLIIKKQRALEATQIVEVLELLNSFRFDRPKARDDEIQFIHAILDRRVIISDRTYHKLAACYSFHIIISKDIFDWSLEGARMIVRIAALSEPAREVIVERLSTIRADHLRYFKDSYLADRRLDPIHILEMKRRSLNFRYPSRAIDYLQEELAKDNDRDENLCGLLNPVEGGLPQVHYLYLKVARAVIRLRFFSVIMEILEEHFRSQNTDSHNFHDMNWAHYLEALEAEDLQTLRSNAELKHLWETSVSASLRAFREEAGRVAEQMGVSRGTLIREAMAAFGFVRNPETQEDFEFKTVEQVDKVLKYVRDRDPITASSLAERDRYMQARLRSEAVEQYARFSFGKTIGHMSASSQPVLSHPNAGRLPSPEGDLRQRGGDPLFQNQFSGNLIDFLAEEGEIDAAAALDQLSNRIEERRERADASARTNPQLREYTPELEAQIEALPLWQGAMTPATNPDGVAGIAAGPQHQIPAAADVMAEREREDAETGPVFIYDPPRGTGEFDTGRVLEPERNPRLYAPPASIDINEIRMGEPHGTATAMEERAVYAVQGMFTDAEYQRAFELSVVTRDLRARVVANENPRDASLLAIHTALRDIFSGPQGFAAFPQAAELTDMLIAGRLNNQEIARMVDAIEAMANGHPLSRALAQLLRNHSQFPERMEPSRAPTSRRIHHMERASLERNLERGNELEPYTAAEEAIRQEIQGLGEMLLRNIRVNFEEGWERDWEIRQVNNLTEDAIRRLAEGGYRGRRIEAPPTVLQGDVQDVDSNVILERLRYLARGNFPQEGESLRSGVSNAAERPLTPEEQAIIGTPDDFDNGY